MRLLLLAALLPLSVWAQELRVLSGGAVKIDYQPMGRLVESLAASSQGGADVDMVIVTEETLPRLEKEGRVQRGAKPLARVGIGVAVNQSAPSPDISTVEAFKRTLLAAKSIVYIDPKVGTSGKHLAEVFARLGIAEQVNAKARLGSGGYIVEPVGRGEIELGIHQISEIIPVKGVKLVGELPRELQKYTTYVAVPVKPSRTVLDFIDHLTGPEARKRLAQAGYTAPE